MTEAKLPDLTPGAKRIADAAEEMRENAGHAALGAHHWLLALCERHNALVGSMLHGADVNGMIQDLSQKLARNELGATLLRRNAVNQAGELALKQGKTKADVRDLAKVILLAWGFIPTARSWRGEYAACCRSDRSHSGTSAYAYPGPIRQGPDQGRF